jgi:hypothetical protein
MVLDFSSSFLHHSSEDDELWFDALEEFPGEVLDGSPGVLRPLVASGHPDTITLADGEDDRSLKDPDEYSDAIDQYPLHE